MMDNPNKWICAPPPHLSIFRGPDIFMLSKTGFNSLRPQKKTRDMSYLPAIRKKIPLPVTISSSLQQHGKWFMIYSVYNL